MNRTSAVRVRATPHLWLIAVVALCSACGNSTAIQELPLRWWDGLIELRILDNDLNGDDIRDVVSVSTSEHEYSFQFINPVDGQNLGEFSIPRPSTKRHRLELLACTNPAAGLARIVVSTDESDSARSRVQLVDFGTTEVVWGMNGSDEHRVSICGIGDLNGDGWSDLALVEGGSTDEGSATEPDFVVVRSGESGEKLAKIELPTNEISWRRGICWVIGTEGTVAVGSPQEAGGGPIAIVDCVRREVVQELPVPDHLRFGSTIVSQDRVGRQLWSLGGADGHFLVECRTALLLLSADGKLVGSLRCSLFDTSVVGDIDGDGYRDFIAFKSENDRSVFAQISGEGSESITVFSGRNFGRMWIPPVNNSHSLHLTAGVVGDVDGRGRDDWIFIGRDTGRIVLGESWE